MKPSYMSIFVENFIANKFIYIQKSRHIIRLQEKSENLERCN